MNLFCFYTRVYDNSGVQVWRKDLGHSRKQKSLLVLKLWILTQTEDIQLPSIVSNMMSMYFVYSCLLFIQSQWVHLDGVINVHNMLWPAIMQRYSRVSVSYMFKGCNHLSSKRFINVTKIVWRRTEMLRWYTVVYMWLVIGTSGELEIQYCCIGSPTNS